MTPVYAWTASILDAYLQKYPEERKGLKRLFRALEEQEDTASRKSFPLHLTGSAAVIDYSGLYILLVFHKKLKLWLPPGGHLEAGESPYSAAVRELAEECGINDVVATDNMPLDVDVHAIPANKAKQEPAHYHCNFAYLFRSKLIDPIRSPENRAVQWARLDSDWTKRTGARVPRIIGKAIAECGIGRPSSSSA